MINPLIAAILSSVLPLLAVFVVDNFWWEKKKAMRRKTSKAGLEVWLGWAGQDQVVIIS